MLLDKRYSVPLYFSEGSFNHKTTFMYLYFSHRETVLLAPVDWSVEELRQRILLLRHLCTNDN